MSLPRNYEKQLTEQENPSPSRQESVPKYPHQNEPQETVQEHQIERTMGHEVRPAPRRQMPEVFPQERALPKHIVSMTVPDLTNASRMMRKPMPRGMAGGYARFGKAHNVPYADRYMQFDAPQTTAPRGSRLDPFKGMRTPTSKKKKTLHHIDPFRFGVN